ncbi:MAG TPA: MBL fold metallo-hydrolase [bacterium]|nr:MBL fold metallo-hydrolase [bacterium]
MPHGHNYTTRKTTTRLLFFICILFAGFAFAGLLFSHQGIAETPKLILSAIDVGQGDSILAEFPNGQVMLVDAGGRSEGAAVVKYLRQRKVSRIDILVASHPHEDHIGGMLAVMDAFQIGKVWDSGYVHGSRTQENFLATIKDKGIRFGTPKSGFTQSVGDARIDVLAPVRPLSGTDSDPNNNSVVLRVIYGQISFLLTGDMESEERNTVSPWPQTTVIKIAHHGSRNGTDRNFLKALSPRVAVISSGRGNNYGHPHSETLSALKSANVKTHNTADTGTVVVSTDGKTISVKTLGPTSHSSASGGGYYGGNKEKSPPPSTGKDGYIGNVNSKIFHRPSCGSLPAEKNRIYFKSRNEAISQGYRPCKKCNP